MSRTQTLIIAIALLGLSGYVGLLLFANMSITGTQNSIKMWQKKGIIPDEGSWQKNLDGLQTAIKYDPENPEYLAYEAELYRYKALMYPPQSSQSVAANREALAKYQHLLTLRPSWAPYWGSIIGIKYELWEYDEQMTNALHNAARLAPWFKANQHIILQTGFHGWPFIDLETRRVINKTLERAMQLQPEPTMRLALDQGFFDRIYPYVQDDEALKEMYERYVASMKKKLKGKEKKK
ncbi:MAG: hypothetical protein GXP23_08905 [Gammaproteobacteria bacterium]|nr:hypothetical protein [Gammaproteobacteria bacterium]